MPLLQRVDDRDDHDHAEQSGWRVVSDSCGATVVDLHVRHDRLHFVPDPRRHLHVRQPMTEESKNLIRTLLLQRDASFQHWFDHVLPQVPAEELDMDLLDEMQAMRLKNRLALVDLEYLK
jgi:hypothetical protein